VGYCPQSEVLWKELTVEQSLRFAGKLRGMGSTAVTAFMVRLLRYFRLSGIERVKVGLLT
jgi:ABC-type multidrug transport system ATPase subunit